MRDYVFSIFRKREGEIDALNGVRAFALISVFFFHSWGLGGILLRDMNPVYIRFLGNLSSGVDCFFVLSGFLIYGNLFREFKKNGDIRFRDFYAKRSLRIFPAYYFALLIIFIIKNILLYRFTQNPSSADTEWIRMLQNDIDKVWISVFYLSDLIEFQFTNVDWSLSVEEHFYLVCPFLSLYLLKRFGFRGRMIVYGILTLVAFCIRSYMAFRNDPMTNFFFFSKFDGLIAGMASYEIYERFSGTISELSRKLVHLCLIPAAAFVYVIAHSFQKDSLPALILRPNLLSVSFAILLLILFQKKKNLVSVVFSFGGLRPIARISYTIYLWHFFLMPVTISVAYKFIKSGILEVSFTVASCIAFIINFLIAWILYLIVEMPFLKWKDRLFEMEKAKID
ncbi:acyltransferase [Leptospira gomenensis]|uniref:Acyltransferase n=1 Tax=Leptospira gomenensis TaxID=2484974 RepID=A0A5F1Y987_9LEPT|nr:acyltransferase [Leptospira gomenensis]TGK32670.1 acyltransferase [Leptospira gomenensis]TGK36818.1 acyltransferase [Leptospira gomenensis]TGK39893.1 acyltransferase [Leptospira gomenensis]TGK58028.1 acyltransferase [Leptospira gomenensis]